MLTTRRWALSVLALVLVLLPLLPTGSASAQSIADKRAEAARLTDAIEKQAATVSRLAEEYNQSRLAADEAAAAVAEAQAAITETDARLSATRSRVRDQSVEAYVRGGAFTAVGALTSSASVDRLSRQRAYLRSVTGQSRDAMHALRAAKQQARERQTAAAAAAATASDVAAEVAARRGSAASAVAAQQTTLDRVTGELSALVAAEQRRRTEEEARRARAEQQAREAARARTTTTTRPRSATPSGPAPGASVPASNPGAAAAVDEARRQIGKPYQWGGSGPDSFDCSGLTMWSWRKGGRSLPHSAQAQYNVTTHISVADIAPGDLVFFGRDTRSIHHNGIYVGDGQMIEASQSGTPIRYRSIARRDLVGVGRVN